MQECYCPATQAKFREWLKAKYGTIEALGRAWHRYSLRRTGNSFTRRADGGYPDSLDWLAFRRDNAMRAAEMAHEAHSPARSEETRSPRTARALFTEIEWRTAADVDSYGYTWVASRHTNDPWMQFHAVDLVRAALARKAILACGSDGRAAVAAAASAQSPSGGRPQFRRQRRSRVEPDRYGRRRDRHFLHSLAAVAGRPPVRSVRPDGDGWLDHAAGGNGQQIGALDQRARGHLEIASP